MSLELCYLRKLFYNFLICYHLLRPSKGVSDEVLLPISNPLVDYLTIWWGKRFCCCKLHPFSASFCQQLVPWNKIVATFVAFLEQHHLSPKPHWKASLIVLWRVSSGCQYKCFTTSEVIICPTAVKSLLTVMCP